MQALCGGNIHKTESKFFISIFLKADSLNNNEIYKDIILVAINCDYQNIVTYEFHQLQTIIVHLLCQYLQN